MEDVGDILEGEPISVPRNYFHCLESDSVSLTLCGFCNTSLQAYAAVI